MSSRYRVLVCGELHEEALQLLTSVAAVDVQTGLAPTELQQVIGRYQALIVSDETKVTQDIIEEALNLRVIGSLSPRLDNVDVTAARTMGIEVRNSPSGNAVAVAEHTLALMLQLATQDVPTSGYPVGLAGKTLGIVGFGRTGREVARRAQAFDMNVIANQPRLTPELVLDVGIGPTDLRELLQRADFVSLHVPSTAETEAIIGASEFNLMQPHAFMINTGHTDLVDDTALLEALEAGRLAGAAVAQLPDGIHADEAARMVRRHPRVLVAPHITHVIGDRRRDTATTVVRQLVEVLRIKRPSETLSLEVVPVEQVSPHERIDDKRVHRLMGRLKEEARLINPPIVTYWNNRYIILDGATRYTALQRLGYPHVIVQVVDAHRDDFELHTWYHVISDERPAGRLLAHLESIPYLSLTAVPLEEAQNALGEVGALCYLIDRDSRAFLARATEGADRLDVMNKLVSEYSAWGTVERTLLTDVERLRGQFPAMKLAAIFPQFDPEDVFETASHGRLLPAGLTRFVIPGRILRLNADLERLRADEALTAKRAWFNDFLAQKLARSRLRYYQEPVILLDE